MSTDCVTPMNCGEGKDFRLHAREQCGTMWDHVEMLLHQSAGSEDAVMQGFVNSKLE